jgi:hypothetical protein
MNTPDPESMASPRATTATSARAASAVPTCSAADTARRMNASSVGPLGPCAASAGSRWSRDYQVFPLLYSSGYDFNRLRGMQELAPTNAQEVKSSVSELDFPLKE